MSLINFWCCSEADMLDVILKMRHSPMTSAVHWLNFTAGNVSVTTVTAQWRPTYWTGPVLADWLRAPSPGSLGSLFLMSSAYLSTTSSFMHHAFLFKQDNGEGPASDLRGHDGTSGPSGSLQAPPTSTASPSPDLLSCL